MRGLPSPGVQCQKKVPQNLTVKTSGDFGKLSETEGTGKAKTPFLKSPRADSPADRHSPWASAEGQRQLGRHKTHTGGDELCGISEGWRDGRH